MRHFAADGFCDPSLAPKKEGRRSPTFFFWCEKRDLNPYGVNHTPLKRARLPVPPLSRMPPHLRQQIILYTIFQKCQYLFKKFLKNFFLSILTSAFIYFLILFFIIYHRLGGIREDQNRLFRHSSFFLTSSQHSPILTFFASRRASSRAWAFIGGLFTSHSNERVFSRTLRFRSHS